MPNFTFEQEVFSLVKLKAKTLNNNFSNLPRLNWQEEIEDEMLRLLVEYKKLEASFAQCSKSKS